MAKFASDEWFLEKGKNVWSAITDTSNKPKSLPASAQPNAWIPNASTNRPKPIENTELLAKGFGAPKVGSNRYPQSPIENTELMAKGFDPNRPMLPNPSLPPTNRTPQSPYNENGTASRSGQIYRQGNSFSNLPGAPGMAYTPTAGLSVIPSGNNQSGESSNDYVNRMNQAADIYRQINESRNGGPSNYVSDAIRELLDRTRPSDGGQGFGLLDYSPQGMIDKYSRSAAARTGTPKERAQLAKAMAPYVELIKSQQANNPSADMFQSLAALQGNMNKSETAQQIADLRNEQFNQNLAYKQQNAQDMLNLRMQQLEGLNQYRQGVLGQGQERNDIAANRLSQIPPAFINAFAQDPAYIGNPEGALAAASEAYSRMTENQLPAPPPPGDAIKVKSVEEAMKLPIGTRFITPDGETRIKK